MAATHSKAISEEEFLRQLRGHIAMKYHNQAAAADAWGLSRAFVSSVVRGKKAPTKIILDEMGYSRERETTTTTIVEYTKQ